jgi:hypothetical protein
MTMDEIVRRVIEGQERGIAKIMVYKDDTDIWEPKEGT